MRCPYCGHKNPNRAKRCEVCGRSLNKVRERRREKRILIGGLVLIAVILAAGVGAMFGVSHVLEHIRVGGDQPQKVTIVTTPTPVPITESDSAETEPSESESESVEEEESPVLSASAVTPEEREAAETVTAKLVDDVDRSKIAADGYTQVTVSSATATSTIQQDGIDNTPHVLYDGTLWSSWQDGVDGDGIGQSITFTFDRTYRIRYLVMRLGNWYSSDDYYYRNNRPSKMTFELGDEEFQVDFPDEKREFVVELSEDVPADSLKMIIDGVYSGTTYQDTCINEVDVFGAADNGTAGSAAPAGNGNSAN